MHIRHLTCLLALLCAACGAPNVRGPEPQPQPTAGPQTFPSAPAAPASRRWTSDPGCAQLASVLAHWQERVSPPQSALPFAYPTISEEHGQRYLAFDGRFAFLGRTDVAIVDIESPSSSAATSFPLETSGHPHQLVVQGDRLVVASAIERKDARPFYATRLSFFDISDRRAPALLAQVDVETGFVAMMPRDGALWFVGTSRVDEGELRSLELSNPAAAGPHALDAMPIIADERGARPLHGCADVYISQPEEGPYFTSMMRFDLRTGDLQHAVTLNINGAGTSFGADTLYLALRHGALETDDAVTPVTVHAVSPLTGAFRPRASGEVGGPHFKMMREVQGDLLVVTAGLQQHSGKTSDNAFAVLRPEADTLRTRAFVPFGAGEVIQDVAMSDRGAYVTAGTSEPRLYFFDVQAPEAVAPSPVVGLDAAHLFATERGLVEAGYDKTEAAVARFYVPSEAGQLSLIAVEPMDLARATSIIGFLRGQQGHVLVNTRQQEAWGVDIFDWVSDVPRRVGRKPVVRGNVQFWGDTAVATGRGAFVAFDLVSGEEFLRLPLGL